jgi:ATP-dependent DNA ligase
LYRGIRGSRRAGATGDWLKVKCIRTNHFVVGGWILGSGRCRAIKALLLGEFVDGALRYVGKVHSGFDAKSLRAIGDALKMQVGSPFYETVPEPDAVFCSPKVFGDSATVENAKKNNSANLILCTDRPGRSLPDGGLP